MCELIIGACNLCDKEVCDNCPQNLKLSYFEIDDKVVEQLCQEASTIKFVKNERGEFVLDQQWRGFSVGVFTINDWNKLMDKMHSKGAAIAYRNVMIKLMEEMRLNECYNASL